MARKTALEFLDRFVAAGRSTFTTAEASEALGLSRQATVNLLGRLVTDGLIERVSRGHYAIRPIGRLGTSAAAEETALAVGAAFASRRHRIAYRSALAQHGLILHPTRAIQVACVDHVRISELSGRPLRVVKELPTIVDVGSIDAGHGARVSDIERALLDAARRTDLIGGLDVASEALEQSASDLDIQVLRTHAQQIGAIPALRRLASIARVRGLDDLAQKMLRGTTIPKSPVPADPKEPSPLEWTDSAAGVVWSSTALDTARRSG